MHTEIERDEEREIRYTQIYIPYFNLETYKRAGWEVVEIKGSIAVVRKEI